MRYNDLCWRGVHASEMGVIVTEPALYKRPALRHDTVIVPGRSGTLSVLGAPTYDVIPYTPTLAIRPGADRDAVYRWLTGRGRVIFGSMPEWAYDAVISDQIDYTEETPGHPAGYQLLIPTFTCQPYRYEVIPTASIMGQEMLAGFNPGNAPAAPLIVATVTPGTVLTLCMSGCDDVVLETPEDAGESVQAVLDCDAQVAYTSEGVALDGAMFGDFPEIAPGSWKLEAKAENGRVLGLSLLPRWRSV